MRQIILLSTVAFIALSAAGASAADMPNSSIFGAPPPGPTVTQKSKDYDWGGLYGGVHASANNASFDSKDNAATMAQQTLPNYKYGNELNQIANTLDKKASANQFGGGIFIGQNWVEDDLMVGVEAEYSSMGGGLKGTINGFQSRVIDTVDSTYVTPAGAATKDQVVLAVTSQSKMTIKDTALVRGRAGYIMGRFMPYATLGVGAARVETSGSSSIREYHVNTTSGELTSDNSLARNYKKDKYAFAVGIGGGLEWAATDNLLLRAEYQWLNLAKTEGFVSSVNQGRIGLALKM